jgi:hypothetical protein
MHTHLGAVLDDDPGQSLTVRDGKRVADRREPRESLPGELRCLVASEEHRNGNLAVTRAEDRGRAVTGLDAETERTQQVVAALRERPARLTAGGAARITAPVPARNVRRSIIG